jgi:hypothetical protein
MVRWTELDDEGEEGAWEEHDEEGEADCIDEAASMVPS